MKINNIIQTSIVFLLLLPLLLFTACSGQQKLKVSNDKNTQHTGSPTTDAWTIESQEDWQANMTGQSNLDITKGKVIPTAKEATFKRFLCCSKNLFLVLTWPTFLIHGLTTGI